MTAVVTAQGVTKRYGDVTALDDVSFALARERDLRPARAATARARPR